MLLRKSSAFFCLLLLLVFAGSSAVMAAEVKIGVMNVQKILSGSKAGKKAKEKLDARAKELRKDFKKDEDELKALQQEIEKKDSVWSKEVKTEKIRELNKKRRAFKAKTDDASFEMRQLQGKELEPVIKKLDEVVKKFGEKNGYTVILDEMRSGVLFLDKSTSVTEQLIKELDKAM